MKVLVTGAAGFIGSYVSHALLDQGAEVVGIDCVNTYYDIRLKEARLSFLEARPGFEFKRIDLSQDDALAPLSGQFDAIIHLAAQAGVRYSLEKPFEYIDSNLRGHLSILEFARHSSPSPFLIYASSSSVYGNDTQAPFPESARCEHPVSLYAATKKGCELLSESYANLYDLDQVGLRFFTVYGPWGRPDMAYWKFAAAMLENRPIEVFNHGDLQRDFTHIDDIVDGILRIANAGRDPKRRHRVYNIGNNRPERLMDFIDALERALGVRAEKIMRDMQPGDVYATAADISAISNDFGFKPTKTIDEGLAEFADWFKRWQSGDATAWR